MRNLANRRLQRALESNRLRDVQAALDAGAEVNGVNEGGDTPLLIACEKGREKAISLLLEAGADIKVTNRLGWSVLSTAVLSGSARCVKLILKHLRRSSDPGMAVRAMLDCRNSDGHQALHVACRYGGTNALEIATELLRAGADTGTHAGMPQVIAEAIYSQNRQLIERLLQHGAALDVTNADSLSALHLAVISRKVGSVRILVELGAALNQRDSAGDTPLLMAVKKGGQPFDDIAKMLVEAGADTHATDAGGQDPYSYVTDPGMIAMMRAGEARRSLGKALGAVPEGYPRIPAAI